MALIDRHQREHIDNVVQLWKQRCLISDGSLMFEGEAVWSPESLARVYHNVVEAPLLDESSFIEKLELQLNRDRSLVLLGAEALVVYYIFAWHGAVSAQTKRQRVNQVLAWADEEIPVPSEVWSALGDKGIGHPGQYFLLRPDAQIGFVLDFARRLKEHNVDERTAIVDDPWALRDFADAGPEEGTSGMRHIVLHLLQPEVFERISSGEHKHGIATTYRGLVDDDIEDVDEQLLAIRRRLEDLLARPSDEVDFYISPLAGTWGAGRSDTGDPIEALELKKQVVLYGPPGTSKTYEAKQVAERIIRRQALLRWTPVGYFQNLARVDELVRTHVRRLQLHPAYSYEEFIRGLRLRGGNVAYENGYLLQLIDHINEEQQPEGEVALPWVLILDELNRADLSRVFGEAFSVLEDRDNDVELAGVDEGQEPVRIRMPQDLYVIGTMNLIDQSLEQIDFALRRRFLWWPCEFAPDRLREVLAERWQHQSKRARYSWDRISADMETFVGRASSLNAEIASSPLLGSDYAVGHTYFFDVIGLLASAEYMNRKHTASQFLWNKKGQALSPVRDLWRMSLKPLLDQYLQGIDADARKRQVEELGRIFLSGAK